MRSESQATRVHQEQVVAQTLTILPPLQNSALYLGRLFLSESILYSSGSPLDLK
jgi:hypothetical protein